MQTGSILDAYVKSAPSPQHAIDIFKGEWASLFPPPYNTLSAGALATFQDGRIVWALTELGGCVGQRVLELGPLEGGHSFMLQHAGASEVIAIEANTRAYLKCLISKEILGLERVRFLCGDFVPYFEETEERFDLIFASGVLYHMRDPVGLIRQLSRHTDRVYMWTQYYDKTVMDSKPHLKVRYPSHEKAQCDGFRYTQHKQEYQNSLSVAGYCGGSADYSVWLAREDLLGAFRHFGFSNIRIANENLEHPHGPCFDLVAFK